MRLTRIGLAMLPACLYGAHLAAQVHAELDTGGRINFGVGDQLQVLLQISNGAAASAVLDAYFVRFDPQGGFTFMQGFGGSFVACGTASVFDCPTIAAGFALPPLFSASSVPLLQEPVPGSLDAGPAITQGEYGYLLALVERASHAIVSLASTTAQVGWFPLDEALGTWSGSWRTFGGTSGSSGPYTLEEAGPGSVRLVDGRRAEEIALCPILPDGTVRCEASRPKGEVSVTVLADGSFEASMISSPSYMIQTGVTLSTLTGVIQDGVLEGDYELRLTGGVRLNGDAELRRESRSGSVSARRAVTAKPR
jgi:hypothetical protein